ncbi:hypothetical protein KIN20_035889 [Parelaphostrongylus tenuis]|uniref:Uncharacterized protein n=1 Tax=Parelaphostrongylus tenuis TaxID=148309 RepID=A0AAD5RBV4_PARTN|nr:hypothetical protein KIN20_035889 [Parelaphostrongylus tenuis]
MDELSRARGDCGARGGAVFSRNAMAAQPPRLGADLIGATVDDVDVESYELVDVKHGPVVIDNVRRRHPTAGVRNRCPYGCGKMIALRTIDYHRTNGCRPGNSKDETFGDTSKKNIIAVVIEHDIHPQIHQLTFSTVEEFKRFLHWLELKGGAHFRHKSGSKRRQYGKGIFMACNRSGFVNSSSATGSERDRIGPYRVGHTCTAYIHGIQHADGRVSIEMCGDHYGHDVRMRLPPIIKSIIAQRQMEGESNADIIDYLRQHFLPYANENVYAQRACLVDHEELRSISATSTKKWEIEGIPTTCEIWEEELLDMVGIVREGVPRIRPLDEKTTEEIAEQQNWPRPNIFAPKVRLKTGEFVSYEMVLEGGREFRDSQYQQNSSCVSPDDNGEESDGIDASFRSMVPSGSKATLSNGPAHKDSNREYVDVDCTEDARFQSTSTNRGSTSLQRSSIPNGTALSKEEVLQKLLFEIDSLRSQILESSHSTSPFTLHYLLLRLKTLRPMIGHVSNSSNRITNNGYPSRKISSGMCQADDETSLTGSSTSYEQSQQRVKADDYMVLSDDEDIVFSAAGAFEYRSYIWRLLLDRSSSLSAFQPRTISTSSALLDSIRDAHRSGTKVTGASKEAMEGTAGAGQLATVNLHGVESRFPTAENDEDAIRWYPLLRVAYCVHQSYQE